MKPTFLPEIDGPNQQIFVVRSAGIMRELWATRIRNNIFNGIIAAGGDPNKIPEKERAEIEKSFLEEATNKFPENANYLVRALEDDGVTPVAIFGEEASVIKEIEEVVPPTCFQYRWFLSRIKPDTKLVTLQYKDCDGVGVTITDTPVNLGPTYDFWANSDPNITDGSFSKFPEE